MMRTLATVVSVDANNHPVILLDGAEAGNEVTALRAGSYIPEAGDRCVVAKVGMRFVAEYAIDGEIGAGLSAYEIAVEHGFTGTEEEWLQSLKGAPGAPGAAGAPGAPGVNGLSAYQVAVANGFTGTEAEWLQSLVGPPGAGVAASANKFPPIAVDFLSGLATAPLAGEAINDGSVLGTTPETNHPGVVRLRSGGSNNTGYRFHGLQSLVLGGGETFELVFKLVVADGVCMFGLHQSQTVSPPVDGVYIRIDGTTLRGAVRKASANYETTTTYSVSAGVWYRIRVSVNAGTTVAEFKLFSEAGGLLWSGTLSGNIPTGVVGINAGVWRPTNTIATDICLFDWLAFTIDRGLVR